VTRIYPAIAAVLSVVSIVAMPAIHAEKVHTVTVHAKKYAFVPAEITLHKGETVKLKLISDDVDHGLAVRALDIRADMPKGKPVEVVVTPEQAGDFAGTCSHFCGMGHGSMNFVVHVVD
jgi:cytochrome c oxidase subunit 2